MELNKYEKEMIKVYKRYKNIRYMDINKVNSQIKDIFGISGLESKIKWTQEVLESGIFKKLLERFEIFYQKNYNTTTYEYIKNVLLNELIQYLRYMNEMKKIYEILNNNEPIKELFYINPLLSEEKYLNENMSIYLSSYNIEKNQKEEIKNIINMTTVSGQRNPIYKILKPVRLGYINILIKKVFKYSKDFEKEIDIIYQFLNNIPDINFIKNKFNHLTNIESDIISEFIINN